MTLQEAIKARHSVRRYKETPLSEDAVLKLQSKIDDINAKGDLHAQLILNEPKGFNGIFAYGKFSGVENYIVMAGKKTADLDERVGYYGEQLVLLAQQLGLNSCWAGLSYQKVPNTYVLEDNEKIACYIAIGYGETRGVPRKSKAAEEISNASDLTPHWFNEAIEYVLLAPTAINQQKFYFEYKSGNKVIAKRLFSLVGYTQMDMGIAKLHLEIGAGEKQIEWVDK